MKNLIWLSLLVFVFACGESKPNDAAATSTDSLPENLTSQADTEKNAPPAPETETESQQSAEPVTETYRSDQARPGVSSEFIKVERKANDSGITGLWYWTDRDSEPMRLELRKTEEYKGEEEGSRGAFRFPGDKKDSKFLIVEGMLEVTYSDGNTQIFEITPG